MKKLLSIVWILGVLSACSDAPVVTDPVAEQDRETYERTLFGDPAFADNLAELERLAEAEAAELEQLNAVMRQAPSQRLNGESFVFLVIGDSELGMRGNTYEQLLAHIEKINTLDQLGLEFPSGDFDDGESRAIPRPELVLLAGDINKDRAFGFSLPGDENAVANQQTNQLFNQLDADILFFAGNGNHDWDPVQFGDGSYGHNLGGLLSNLGTAQFVRSRFNRALNASAEVVNASFNYDRNTTWFPLTSSAEFNYSFDYKGVRFTQLNQFLQQPVAMVSLESLFGTGPAWYFPNRTTSWFQRRCEESAQNGLPHVVVQHFPVNTGDSWWNDDLGGTPGGLRKAYMDVFSTSHSPVMFSGHNHSFRNTTVEPYGIADHTSGYFANGYVIVARASAEKGVYAVAHVNLNTGAVTDPATLSTVYQIPQ